jgi:hypothetical protein
MPKGIEIIMVIKMEIIKAATLAQNRLTYQIVKSVESGIAVYGIKIVSTLFDSTEEHLVSDVTVDRGTIDRLFDLCVEHAVLPSSLQDICEDFIVAEAIVA